MKTLFTLFAVMLGVSACAPKPITKAGRPSQYSNQQKAVGFSGWYIEGCQAVMRASDMQISTDGKINSNRQLNFKINSSLPLLAMPRLSFNTIDWTPPAVGKSHNFAFRIPYNQNVAAKMANDYAFLIITYQNTTDRALQQHFFKLVGLPHALAYLQGKCG